MKKIGFLIRDLIRDERGAITVMTIIMMFAFVGILAIVIDLGHLHTVQNELRNAADTCALRGARGFFDDGISLTGLTKVDPNPGGTGTGGAVEKAMLAIGDNKSDNKKLVTLPEGEIEVGIWYYKAAESPDPNQQLQPWGVWPPPLSEWGKYIGPGIRLPVIKDDTHNEGPVSMSLAKLLGQSTVPVSNVKATAALSGVSNFPEGYGTFPIAVDVDKVTSGEIIFFSPDFDDVGGWTSLGPKSASANEFKGLINGTIDSPLVQNGDIINLQNGVACSAIKEAIDTYPSTEVSKGVYQPNPQPVVWFPGVQVDTFNQSAVVVGGLFAKIIELRDSSAPKDILIPGSDPPKYTGDCMIKLDIQWGVAPGTQSGGPFYGVLSLEPKLVQ